MTSTRTKLALALALALTAACNKAEEPSLTAPTSAPKPAASAATASPASTSADRPGGKLTWEAPAAFKKSDAPSSMRLATYSYPKAPGDPEDGELAVSTAGGTLEQNVRRWVGQFEGASYEATKQTKLAAGPYEATIVELEGNYAGMSMPGKPSPGVRSNWAMLAAVVPAGGTSYFFKLTGPVATVKAARADFETLVASIKGAP